MKDKFIKSTIILLIGGIITKILGMTIKIVMNRLIGSYGIGMYMLILPTFSLLINLSQFGLPISISKLISEQNRKSIKLISSIIPISIIINILLIILIIIFAPIISNNLLHNKDTLIPILSMSLVIPFTSISSICRSYFFGKEKMFPHVLSNIVEDITRLVLIIIIIPKLINLEIKIIVTALILLNIISELISTITLLFFIPKNITINKNDLIPEKTYINDSLRISIPNTIGRLIGNIGYFLEPIIITYFLLKKGYSNTYITHEYGIINGYILPLLLLPSLFSLAISQALLPEISKEYTKGNINIVKNKIKKSIIISITIGIIVSIIILFYGKILLKLIYNTNKGINYIKILSPIFIIQYIEAPLSASLDAMGKSKDNMIASIISLISRTISLYLFSLFNIGIYSLIISIIINILMTATYLTYKIYKYLG